MRLLRRLGGRLKMKSLRSLHPPLLPHHQRHRRRRLLPFERCLASELAAACVCPRPCPRPRLLHPKARCLHLRKRRLLQRLLQEQLQNVQHPR